MCRAQNKMVRQKLLNAGENAYYAIPRGFIDGNIIMHLRQGVMRDEIQRALRARMREEQLIAHYFVNTDHDLWK